MQVFKRSTAWLMLLCLVLGLALSVGPVAPKVNAVGDDPYVYTLGPSASSVPSYYRTYAKSFVGWSPFEVGNFGIGRVFNLTNVGEIIQNQSEAPSGAYASVDAFCGDRGTPYYHGAKYRRINLEEAHFAKSGTAADLNKAKKVRAILRHSLPYYEDASTVQAAANAYFGSEKVTNLTNAELVSAAQAAVWHFTNDIDFGNYAPFAWWADFKEAGNAAAYADDLSRCMSLSDPINVYEKERSTTKNNINRVYEYLVNLPGEETNEVLIHGDALSLEKAFLEGSGDNCTLTLFVGINGTVNSDEELVLSARCGDETQTLAIGKGGTLGIAEGLFPITLTGVSEAECSDVELELTGDQTVQDAFFFEAEGGRYGSQGLASYGVSTAPVYATATVDALTGTEALEITKVDAKTGNPLTGVSFDLYLKQDGTDLKIGTYITDEKGKISLSVTDADEYYFLETEALAGYEAVTDKIDSGEVPNTWSAGSLEVTKKLINNTPAQPGETFNFKLTLDLSTAPVMDNGIYWMTPDYLMGQMESSKKLTWSASGDKLTAAFTLNVDETVTVDSIPLGATYTLEEVQTKEDREWFNVTSKVDDGKTQQSNIATGSVAAKNTVLFTNEVVTSELKLGELAVSKKLVNETPAQMGETFNFKITLDLSTADAITNSAPWLTEEYLLEQITCDEDLTWTEKDGKYTATFTVDADETVTVKGIARGTAYTVEEILSAEERKLFNVTTKVGEEDAKSDTTAAGTIAEENAVLFTNSVVTGPELKLGALEVSKKLINTTPAVVGETFNFQITVDFSTANVYTNGAPWMNDEYLLGKVSSSENLTWTEKDGKYTATFTVDADETVTVEGLAYGTSYTVKEILTEEDRQWFTVTSKVDGENAKNSATAAGTIAESNAVLFTNSVVTGPELKLGSLAVSKALINTTPAVVGETFNFKITVDFSTADVYTNAAPWMNDEYLLGKVSSSENLTWTEKDGKYVATFTVDADETVTIEDLAYGTTYTVEEILTEEDRQWFVVTSKVCNEPMANSSTAQGSIANLNAVLFTNTVVTGPELKLSDLNVSKKLVNETPAQVGETFDFRITLDLSTADVYTDAAPWMNDEYLMGFVTCSEELTWTEKDGKYTATFTVDADETVVIEGLAYGVTYTLEEVMTEEDWVWFNVTSKVGNEAAQETNVAQGSVGDVNAVLFTNSVVTAQLKRGTLDITKKLINTTPAQVGDTFQFRITVDFASADIYSEGIPWVTDEYLLNLIRTTEVVEWTEQDGKFSAIFTVKANETVSFNGLACGATYTIEEVLTEEDQKWFESSAQVGGVSVGSVARSQVAEQNTVVFTNSVVTGPVLVTGSVEVSKKLVNTTPAVVGETFNFQITLDLSTADVYTDAAPWMNDEYLMGFVTCSEELTWTEKDGKYTATFTVDVDETVSINGIAQGTTYTVQEVLTEEDREWFEVTSQIGDEDATDSDTVVSTVAEKNAVTFTNSVVTGPELKLGDPSVSKKLINTTPADIRETFDFQITVDFSTADVYTDAAPWMNDEYLLSFINSTESLTWTEKDGKYTATFTVDVDETVTIAGMAYGATYTMQEIMTEEDREWFTVTCKVGEEDAQASDTAESTVGENNAIVFTNTVVTGPELVTGDVEVSKKLVNTTPAVVGETFNFRITLDLSTADVYTNAAPWMNDEYLMSFITGSEELTWVENDGKYTADFTVNADETVSINGIAQGTTYTVQEVLTEEDREWFEVTSQIGEEDATDSDTVESTVAEKNAVTFTNSVVTGIALATGRLEVGKELVDAPAALADKKFTFRITLDLSAADIYQDPVPWMHDEYLLDRIEGNQELTWTKSGEKKYTATFTLKAGQAICIDGIAQGVGYTIEEVLTKEERYNYRVTTAVSRNGGDAVTGETSLVSGNIAQTNDVTFVNKFVAPIPVTDDLSLTAPLVLCLMAVLMTAVLMLNKRRFIG